MDEEIIEAAIEAQADNTETTADAAVEIAQIQADTEIAVQEQITERCESDNAAMVERARIEAEKEPEWRGEMELMRSQMADMQASLATMSEAIATLALSQSTPIVSQETLEEPAIVEVTEPESAVEAGPKESPEEPPAEPVKKVVRRLSLF